MSTQLISELIKGIAEDVEKFPNLPSKDQAYKCIQDLFEAMRLIADMAEQDG